MPKKKIYRLDLVLHFTMLDHFCRAAHPTASSRAAVQQAETTVLEALTVFVALSLSPERADYWACELRRREPNQPTSAGFLYNCFCLLLLLLLLPEHWVQSTVTVQCTLLSRVSYSTELIHYCPILFFLFIKNLIPTTLNAFIIKKVLL